VFLEDRRVTVLQRAIGGPGGVAARASLRSRI
jgi:hypothetical protein